MAGDSAAKTKWEKENVVKLLVKINKNTDPELYDVFTRETGSKSGIARELMQAGLTTLQQKDK